MKTREIIPFISDLLKNESGLFISLLFRKELLVIKEIMELKNHYGFYDFHYICEEIENKIDPTIISLLMTDAQKYINTKANMANLLNSAETTRLYPGNGDISYNLVQPVPITIDGKIVTLNFDEGVDTTSQSLKKSDPEYR